MTTRQDLAATLATDLPAMRVVGFAEAVEPILDQPVVVVCLTNVDRPRYVDGTRGATFDIIVAVALTTPGTADDALEDALGDVLDALDVYPWGLWSGALRSTYLETYPSFTITLSIGGQTQ